MTEPTAPPTRTDRTLKWAIDHPTAMRLLFWGGLAYAITTYVVGIVTDSVLLTALGGMTIALDAMLIGIGIGVHKMTEPGSAS